MGSLSADDPALVSERVLDAVRSIAPGSVLSYGAVGRRAGLPHGARLVARVLAGNSDPQLPWHRVLRADGRIAFPRDSARWREQQRRLRAEGVSVVDGRVRLPKPAESLDHEVWGFRG